METNDNWSVSPPTSLGKASKEEQAQLLDFLASPLVAAAFDEDCDDPTFLYYNIGAGDTMIISDNMIAELAMNLMKVHKTSVFM